MSRARNTKEQEIASAKKHTREVNARSREAHAAVSDIGDIPAIINPARRDACRLDLFRFLTTYFPQSTGLSPFSNDHRRVIERIQQCVLAGGMFVNAVYRGFGKTTVSENAAIWAVSYGHRKMVPVFGAESTAASGNIDSIKMELAENDLLLEDFPEVCFPIRALEGKVQRCASQTHHGERTYVAWTADTIVLPTIPGSLASAGIITAHGLLGASRGMKYKRPDGIQQRPDFVIIDDPQTDDSASSGNQINKRLKVIQKAILKGGGLRKMAVVMNATIIQPDDMIEQLLDHKLHPAWQGERIKMVPRFADMHETMWLGDYQRLRNTYNPEDLKDQQRAHKDATAFYVREREAMDKGCIVSWEHCLDKDTEISAIQHAYNCLIDDGLEVFSSECQNEPLRPHEDAETLKAGEIAAKTNGLDRGKVPLGAEHLTAFVDVQGDVLYWLVAAWAPDFTGSIIDYGGFPEQGLPYFTLAGANKTLTKRYKGTGLEGRIQAGLDELTNALFAKEWKREDGAVMRLGRCLIDANWGKSTATVNEFCRRSKHAALVMPSHGKYVGASSIPWEFYTKREGERLGNHWMIPSLKGKVSAIRHVLIDTNFWKSFIHTRLAIRFGDRGSLSLFGHSPEPHRMIADHISSEFRVVTEGRGRKLDEWRIKPGRPDNHLLDCLVGAFVAASMSGCIVGQRIIRPPAAKARKKVAYL